MGCCYGPNSRVTSPSFSSITTEVEFSTTCPLPGLNLPSRNTLPLLKRSISGKLAESTGVEYHKLDAIERLGDYLGALPERGIRVLEIETDRYRDAAFRKELFRSISRSL